MTSVATESLVLLTSDFSVDVENIEHTEFTLDKVFEAASEGDKTQLDGLLQYLEENDKKLSRDFRGKDGRTALMNALMNLKGGKNDTIEVLLEIAEKTGDLRDLINASCTAPNFKGFTALHVAIERRSLDYVKLLIEKGADVKAKAEGTFSQPKLEQSFYFGELPLSLAACTNQKKIVSFLIKNEKVNVEDQDSQGNTVLHALVATADNTPKNTKLLSQMYDEILIRNYKLKKNNDLESVTNNRGLTSIQLAAKLGKRGMLKHILNRRFPDEELRPLSRKIAEWVCGPVQTSLYDVTSVDPTEENSVLETIFFRSKTQNCPEMLLIEPLRSLLQDKWDKFASRVFFIQFVFYVMYLIIFTAVAYNRKDGQPPFPVETTGDILHSVGTIISIIGAIRILYKSITFIIWRRHYITLNRTIHGVFDEFFFLQAALVLLSAGMYICGLKEYVELLVLSVALAWGNLLYYARGFKKLGIYVVMMQRMTLNDLLHFLCIYFFFILGFSVAVVTLMKASPTIHNNTTDGTQAPKSSFDIGAHGQKKMGYHENRFTLMEMFKFTIGMGNLDFTDDVENKLVFYILLISYILLTYILMLNMLIAMMSNTVERTSKESEKILNLQRAFTIIDVKKSLLGRKSWTNTTLVRAWFDKETDPPKYFRVIEKNWKKMEVRHS